MTACTYSFRGACGAPAAVVRACPLARDCSNRARVAAGVAKRLTGTAGDTTADLFDARASETPLFSWHEAKAPAPVAVVSADVAAWLDADCGLRKAGLMQVKA